MKKTDETVAAKRADRGFAAQLGKAVAGASAMAKDTAAKTQKTILSAVDKNGNGKIDRDDFGLGDEDLQEAKEKAKKLASAAEQSIRTGSDRLGKALSDAKLEMDRKNLRPVFAEELCGSEGRPAQNPKIVCIVGRDKRRSESEACNGSVGYRAAVKGMDVLHLYGDCAQQLGLVFYPELSETVYYADPCQSDVYINLDEYFDFLKKARVNELELIAQELGAKRVQITFKERRKTIVAKKAKTQVSAAKSEASGTYDQSGSEFSSVEIAADIKFSGHNIPVVPKLVYFKNESDIEKLIQMRTGNSENKIESKTYKFQCSRSSGITEKEAAQIDAVLGQMKCSGTASVSSEAQRESRTELEYRIEF